jgi:hypothetical protein
MVVAVRVNVIVTLVSVFFNTRILLFSILAADSGLHVMIKVPPLLLLVGSVMGIRRVVELKGMLNVPNRLGVILGR